MGDFASTLRLKIILDIVKSIFFVNISTYRDVDSSSDPYTGCLYVSGEHAPEMYVSGEHE